MLSTVDRSLRFVALGSPTANARVSFGADASAAEQQSASAEKYTQAQRRAFESARLALETVVADAKRLADFATRKVIDSQACSAWTTFTGKNDALCSSMTHEAVEIERDLEQMTYLVRDATAQSFRDPSAMESWIRRVGSDAQALVVRAKKVVDVASWSFLEQVRKQFLESISAALAAVGRFQEDLIAAGFRGVAKGIGPAGLLLMAVGGFFLVRNVMTLAGRG